MLPQAWFLEAFLIALILTDEGMRNLSWTENQGK